MSEQILKLLEKSSAQNPIGFNDLIEQTDLLPKTLNLILDNMIATRVINEATVTKHGITQRMVWRTGVVSAPVRQSIVINPNYVPQSGHLTRPIRQTEKPAEAPVSDDSESKDSLQTEQSAPQNQANVEAENAAAPAENMVPKNLVPQKPKALQFLEYIEANPNTWGREIEKALNIDGIAGYLKDHVSRGHIKVDYPVEGTRKPHYRLESGLTADDIYSGRARLSQAAAENKIAEHLIPKFGAFKTPTVSKMEIAKLEVVKPSEDKLLIDAGVNGDSVFNISKALKEPPAQKIRFALTTDQTLIIMGINYLPIELSKQESDDLIKFCGDIGMARNVGDVLNENMAELLGK